MNYNLVKHIVEKGDKKFVNYSLINDLGMKIDIKPKMFFDDNGKPTRQSKFNEDLMFRTADDVTKVNG